VQRKMRKLYALRAGGAGGRGAHAGAQARAAARGRGGLVAQAGARSGQTGGVEAAGNPGAGVAPPAAPAAEEVACRDAAAVQNFGSELRGEGGRAAITSTKKLALVY